MNVAWWIVSLAIWTSISVWRARVAGRKRHSFMGFFLFSLLFFPAALIVAYMVRDQSVSRA